MGSNAHVPLELLVEILNRLSQPDVLNSSHVSRLWRDTAQMKDEYYHSHRLSETLVREGNWLNAIDRWRQHAEESHGWPVLIDLNLRGPFGEDEMISAAALRAASAIGNALARTRQLALSARWPTVLECLVAGLGDLPAPNLRRLRIYLPHNWSTPWPHRLLSCGAPRLQELVLFGVAPPQTRLDACAQVLDLNLFDSSFDVRHVLCRNFPALRTLCMDGCTHVEQNDVANRDRLDYAAPDLAELVEYNCADIEAACRSIDFSLIRKLRVWDVTDITWRAT